MTERYVAGYVLVLQKLQMVVSSGVLTTYLMDTLILYGGCIDESTRDH
jgi:hypothetical protein